MRFLILAIIVFNSLAKGGTPGDFRKELALFSPDYKKTRTEFKKLLKQYSKRIQKKESLGKPATCVRQVYKEAKWYVGYTAYFDKTKERFKRIERLLSGKENDFRDPKQDKITGLWGSCFTEWFLKLDLTNDYINDLHRKNKLPQYQIKFFDELNSPKALNRLLDDLLISDVKQEGLFHRKELNYVISALMRMILRDRPSNYKYHPDLKSALTRYIIEKWQDKESGYWGGMD